MGSVGCLLRARQVQATHHFGLLEMVDTERKHHLNIEGESLALTHKHRFHLNQLQSP